MISIAYALVISTKTMPGSTATVCVDCFVCRVVPPARLHGGQGIWAMCNTPFLEGFSPVGRTLRGVMRCRPTRHKWIEPPGGCDSTAAHNAAYAVTPQQYTAVWNRCCNSGVTALDKGRDMGRGEVLEMCILIDYCSVGQHALRPWAPRLVMSLYVFGQCAVAHSILYAC